jgi:hypothetical protein
MHNLPDWFTEKWQEEVTLKSQQMRPAIADTIANGGLFAADTVYFPRIGTVEALDGARLQVFATQSPNLDWIAVQADPKFLPIKIWDPDKSKLTIPVVQEFATVITGGINRAMDDMVVDAFVDAATNGVTPKRGRAREAQADPATENMVTIGDYATVVDWDVISEAIARLGEVNVDVENEQITLVTSPRYKVNLALDPLMTSGNTNMKDLPWSKLSLRSSTRLPGLAGGPLSAGGTQNGTEVDMFLYARSAAVSAWNNQVTDINERLGAILGDMIGQWFQGGAAVKSVEKIIRIKGKQNYSVTRKATPIDNIGN